MPQFAAPIPAPALKKKATPAAPRPQQRGPGAAQRAAIGHVLQRRAVESAAAEAAPKAPNRTGLPKWLKAGVERLSGLAMDDVRVHRNSSEPANFGALAHTRGSDIHLGPGQEQHLPHESWHVVQQKQGRVPATTQMKGASVNNDSALEAEADGAARHLTASRSSADAAAPLTQSVRATGGRRPLQLQKGPKAKKGDGPSNLAEQVTWQKEYKHSQTIPARGFDVTLSLAASASFEHKTLKELAEALTQVKAKNGETTVGVELNLKAREIRKLVAAVWKKEAADKILHPGKISSSITTTVGKYSVETKMTPVPLTIESTVTPKEDLVIELGKGFRAVVSAEYKIKAVQKEEPRVRTNPEPVPETSPWPLIIAGLLALVAFIAEFWWVPVVIII